MHKLTAKKIIDKLFFMLGIVSTMTLVRIPIPGRSITGNNFLIYIIVAIYILFQFRKITHNTFDYYVLAVLATTVVAIIMPIGSEYVKTTLIGAINYGLFYWILYQAILRDSNDMYKISYFKGLKISVVAQLVWEYMQILLWFGAKINLNQLLFSKIPLFADIAFSQVDLFGSYRFTGIGWIASNLGISLLIGFILYKDIRIRILFAIGMIASTSRVGIIGMFFVIAYEWLTQNQKQFKQKKIHSFSMLLGSGILMFGILWALTQPSILDGIVSNFSIMLTKFKEFSWDLHFLYYLWLPELLGSIDFVHLLFGFGHGCSGYPYSIYKNVYPNIGPWVPENDYCDVLLGTGLLGFFLFYFWYLSNMRKRREKKTDFMILLTVLFCGFFYGFIDTWLLVILLMCTHGEDILTLLSQSNGKQLNVLSNRS